MLEWLATIGAAELGKVVFEQVLKLGQAAAEDYVKDFFKGCIKGGILAAKPEVAKKATAQAVQAFLLLMVDELEDQGVSRAEIRDSYDQPMVWFVQDEAVKPILGSAFEKDCRVVDVVTLASIWQRSTFKGQLFPAVPEGFDWEHVSNEYLRKVRRIVRESPELRSLLETELLEDIARNTAHLSANLSPGFDVAKYRNSLQTSYGYLKLYTLDSTDRVDAIKLWNMFIEQTVREALPPMRYALPLDLKRQLQEKGQLEGDLSPEALEHYRREYFQQPSRKAFEAIADSQKAVILGDPGAGKSSLLQYLALEWVEGKTETLPLLIELREYAIAQANGFLEFLHRGRGADWQFDQQQLHQYLLEHPTLVMFDGLDEVFDRPTQSTVIDDIIRFAHQYPKAKVLVTSRIIGYNPERLQHAEFKHFTIQPLDTDEIHEFIDRWYTLALVNDPDKPRLVQRLKDAIANSKAIENLADNPLLLTMMAILNRRQELPRDRADLYDQASRVLLYHWDVDHKRLQLPMDAIGRREKQEMLRAIAYEMQAGDGGLKGNLISAERLTQVLTNYLREQGFSEPREKASRLIDQLRHRNFILCDRGADTYGFVHRTFLEYFCTVEIINRFEKQRTLTFEQLQDEVFGNHWQDETWHEVLCLICGMINAKFASKLIHFLIKQEIDSKFLDFIGRLNSNAFQHLLLASDCLIEIKERHLISSIENELLLKLQATINLAPKGVDESVVKSIFFRIAKVWSDRQDVKDWLYKCINLEAKVCPTSSAAVKAIVQIQGDSSETFSWLKSLVDSANNSSVKASALRMLSQYSRNDPEILEILKCQTHNQNVAVVNVAVQELAERWANYPEVLSVLQNAADADMFGIVRASVIRALAKFWKHHPNTLLTLKECAKADQSNLVRVAAIEGLAGEWKSDPEVLQILQDRAQYDDSPDVQVMAIQRLAYGWKKTPEILEVFNVVLSQEFLGAKHISLLSSRINPRLEALKAITINYATYPKTLKLLHDRAINDPDEQLREWAQEQLEKLEKAKK